MNYQKPEITVYKTEELLKIKASAGSSSDCGKETKRRKFMNYQKPEIIIYEAEELLKIEASAGSGDSCGINLCGILACNTGVWR